jgi:hypothetical protein
VFKDTRPLRALTNQLLLYTLPQSHAPENALKHSRNQNKSPLFSFTMDAQSITRKPNYSNLLPDRRPVMLLPNGDFDACMGSWESLDEHRVVRYVRECVA